MGLDDKMQQAKGKMKEGMGNATNNEQWQAEGQADQTKGKAKDKLDDLADDTAKKLHD